MPEYDFPSGRLTTAFDLMDWIGGVQAGLWFILVASIVVFVWRCFRPSSGVDVVGWGMFLAVTFIFWDWLATEDGLLPGEVQPFRVFIPMVAFAGIVVSSMRVTKNWAIRVVIGIAALFGLQIPLYPTFSTPREVSRRSQCKNHLKLIGLALHNYHDIYQSFPPAGDDAEVLAWRIALLPLVDHLPLFQQFHLDEPWNSPHNATLQEKRPDVYRCPSHSTEKRFTSYAMLRGPGTVGGEGTAGMPIRQVRDGTSSTLLVVEACGREIIWTEPKDVETSDESFGVNLPGDQPGRSRGAIASYHRGGAHVLLADGTVRYISDKTDPHVIRILSNCDDGEPTPEF
jgi:hypothetical protein